MKQPSSGTKAKRGTGAGVASKPSPRTVSAADALEVFGHYVGGQAPAVISPVQTKNRWSFATLAHEQTHQNLTLNTTFGFFSQLLGSSSCRDTYAAEFEMCIAAQWGVQEGVATYVQLAHIASRDPEGYDDVLSELPSEQLGQPAYREWFDALAGLVPILDDDGRVSERLPCFADFVVALGVYALNNDVLSTFPQRRALNTAALDVFLSRNAPDIRLRRMIRELGSDHACGALLDEFDVRRSEELGSTGTIATSLDWLAEQVSGRDPDDVYLDNDTRQAQSFAVGSDWLPNASVRTADRGDEPVATVEYTRDWVDRFPDAFPNYGLTIKALEQQLALVDAGEIGLACSIAMFQTKELHLTTLAYPRGVGVNPESWGAIKALVEDPAGSPATAAVLTTKGVLRAFSRVPEAPLWVDFIEDTWRVWDHVAARRRLFRNAVFTCTHVELSERNLRTLLDFRGIGHEPHYFVYPVSGQQYVACIFRPDVTGVYALAGVQGEAGLEILAELARRMNLRPYNGAFETFEHALLLRLAGQGFLL